MPPLVVLNAVGLTPRLLPYARAARAGRPPAGCGRLRDVLPAVT